MLINWNNIRNHQGSQDLGFEELCCQLFRADPPTGQTRFERRGCRDAGLECAHIGRDGSIWGMQAKYFVRSPTQEQWRQIEGSIATAMKKNPSLVHLTVCIPQNLDDPKITRRVSAMERWRTITAAWKKSTKAGGRRVEFELWGDTQLTERLIRPENQGRRWYFFNQRMFTEDWFQHCAEDVAENAKPRYSQELNVDLPIAQLFEGLARTKKFALSSRSFQGKLARGIESLSRYEESLAKVGAVLADIISCGRNLEKELARSDWEAADQLPLDRMSELASQTREKAHAARRGLEDLDREEERKARIAWEAKGKGESFFWRPLYSEPRNALWEVGSAAADILGFVTSKQSALANNPLLLVAGPAGVGKTHLLVDVAVQSASTGRPSVLLLGENFQAGRDPLRQAIEMLGLTLDGEEFLQALDAAAEATGGRALLMIDALNEGGGLDLWPKQLAGLLSAIQRHQRIGVAVSVRTTYEEAVVPKQVLNRSVQVIHEGFASRPEFAARAFFAHYSINLPGVPLLNPEYSNPLFLKLLCEGLNKAGVHDIPQGSEGLTSVFDFLVDATEQRLIRERKLDCAPYQHPVMIYLEKIAANLAESTEGMVSFPVADAISHDVYDQQGYSGSLLDLLLREGLLAKEMIPAATGTQRSEGVRFAYQRFGDHRVAKYLLDLSIDHEPKDAFSGSGSVGRLFSSPYSYFQYRGLLEALAILVPERFGCELVDVLPRPNEEDAQWAFSNAMSQCFLDSLPWRKRSTITKGTLATLRKLITTRGEEDQLLEVLLTVSAIPGHPLNAEHLHNILRSMPLPKRDVAWTTWLCWHHEDEGAVDRLITWGLLSEAKEHLSDESILLASTAISWFTASTVRLVRDKATKSLVNLLTPRPHLVGPLLDRFSLVDDTYVLERLYSVAYGIAMRISDRSALKLLAEQVHDSLFVEHPPKEHVLVRDYGRCVVERALAAGCLLPFDLVPIRPPYGSAPPREPPARRYFERKLPRTKEWTDRDRAISFVVNRFGEPDISRYLGGPSLENPGFSAIKLGEAVPRSRRKIREEWESKLSDKQRRQWQVIQSLRFAGQMRQLLTRVQANEIEESQVSPKNSSLEPEAELARQTASLEKLLDPEQRREFREYVLPRSASRDNGIPSLPTDYFARCVVNEALRMGWSAKRFAEMDATVGRITERRNESHWERFGEKYLRMAYCKVFAQLADNYYLLKDSRKEEVEPFDGSWQSSLRNIDPSLVPRTAIVTSHSSLRRPLWWQPPACDLGSSLVTHTEWLRRKTDLPDIKEILLRTAADGSEWVSLECYPSWDQRDGAESETRDLPRRHLWLQVRGYLTKRSMAKKVFEWMKGKNFMGRWMPEGLDLHGLFYGEYPLSPAWNRIMSSTESPYERWLKADGGCPAKLACVQDTYMHEGDDASFPESPRAMWPRALIVEEAGLQWSGNDAAWMDESGQVVVLDPAINLDITGMLMMRRDFLDRFLNDRGYCLLWTIIGEKLVFNWDPRFPRLNISGSALYASKEPLIQMRASYEGRDGGKRA